MASALSPGFNQDSIQAAVNARPDCSSQVRRTKRSKGGPDGGQRNDREGPQFPGNRRRRRQRCTNKCDYMLRLASVRGRLPYSRSALGVVQCRFQESALLLTARLAKAARCPRFGPTVIKRDYSLALEKKKGKPQYAKKKSIIKNDR